MYGNTTNEDGTPQRQHVVRQIDREVVRIFEEYVSGFGLSRIAKGLNAVHVPPLHGGRAGWCPSAIREILRRDLYRGIVWWNRTQTWAEGEAGRRTAVATWWGQAGAHVVRMA